MSQQFYTNNIADKIMSNRLPGGQFVIDRIDMRDKENRVVAEAVSYKDDPSHYSIEFTKLLNRDQVEAVFATMRMMGL